MTQVDVDGAGRPVMLSREWHVPSVMELRVYRRGPGRVRATAPDRGPDAAARNLRAPWRRLDA